VPDANAPLSLGPASRLLGVDPDTLRRWADDGRIDVFTTAGGHRRFSRSTLERVLQARRHDGTMRLQSLDAVTERVARAYRRGYAREADVRDVKAAVQPTDRDAFRDGGRALVASLLEHLDAADDAGREVAEAAALAATDDLARRLAGAGIGLAEAVSLFVAARRPFQAELGQIARRRALDPERLTAIYDASAALLDRLLLRLVTTHEAATA
jgi:excisionase family DNA binding protein